MWEYQWFYPTTESELLELLAEWDFVGWHNVYHAVMLRKDILMRKEVK